MKFMVASVSVGIVKNKLLCDLNYSEDSIAEVDLSVVMTEYGCIVEVQGAAEKKPIDQNKFFDLLFLAKKEISKIIKIQKKSLNL